MNFWKYLGNIFVTPYLMIKNFTTPPATILKKNVTPNARSAEYMQFGGYYIKQNFIKICRHPIIFFDPPS